MKKNNKIYKAKKIYIGHITIINPEALPGENIAQSVLALRQVQRKNQQVFVPINPYFPYYSINKVIPITTKMKRTSPFITTFEINQIIDTEKREKRENPRKQNTIEKNVQIKDFASSVTLSEIATEEKEIQKVKKLVA